MKQCVYEYLYALQRLENRVFFALLNINKMLVKKTSNVSMSVGKTFNQDEFYLF